VVGVLDAGVRLGLSPSLSLAPGPDREGLALLLRAVRREVARERWAQFTTENAKFFDQLGAPDGAAKTGPLPYDTDCIASYVTSRQRRRGRPTTAQAAAPKRRPARATGSKSGSQPPTSISGWLSAGFGPAQMTSSR
jgi:hypothetical protein